MNPLKQSIRVWCTTYPRRVTQFQSWADDLDEVYDAILEVNGESPGYVSVYGFPHGHTTDGNVPVVDTMFLDLDIPSTGSYRGSNIGNESAWERDLSALLTRVRLIANALVEEGVAHHWRAALSGHKGVHLYLDFPPIDPANGSVEQFRNGLSDFASKMVDEMEEQTGVELRPWVDVSSADLARLTRLPNTVHDGATNVFGERRYCVPVTIKELTAITPERYRELTSGPRPVPVGAQRMPSERAATTLTQFIRQASSTAKRSGGPKKAGKSLEQYEKEANHEIEVDDLPMLLSARPCLWDFPHRDDCYDHGNESHMMKLAVLTELANKGVPLDTVLDLFDRTPNHDRDLTRQEFEAVVHYGYVPFKHETIENYSPTFLSERCSECRAAMNKTARTAPMGA